MVVREEPLGVLGAVHVLEHREPRDVGTGVLHAAAAERHEVPAALRRHRHLQRHGALRTLTTLRKPARSPTLVALIWW